MKLQYNIQGESIEQIFKNSYLCMSCVTNLKNQIKQLNLCSDSTMATNRMPNKLENFNCTGIIEHLLSVKRLQSKKAWNIYFKLSPMVQYNPVCYFQSNPEMMRSPNYIHYMAWPLFPCAWFTSFPVQH